MIFFPVQINLIGFKINVLDRNASISIGPSVRTDFNAFTKANTFQTQSGDLPVAFSTGAFNDSDLFDSTDTKESII
ncbi:hypothetical protein [Desulfotomaculum copahuensis]|uniref:Uncharacterized protein n=1 Tax=Desulfotomaculum copahuensis TaxID=1838280 RepID=A0A1B7LDV8_9FIRM|nr:hypothetical protein [Desulfotomaculum copahuensis]OAT81259.1 hypothetical protein A6M21_00220 [Desulfotomaculum copahuensis]